MMEIKSKEVDLCKDKKVNKVEEHKNNELKLKFTDQNE